MPCAAGSRCVATPDHTPAPPQFTNHTCRVCGGYLHGLCGVPDPLSDNEMHRVCHGCVNSNNRKESSTDSTAGAASSKRPCAGGRATGKAKQADALGSLNPVGNTAPRKVRGAENRKRPTLDQKVRALDLLKSMSGTVIAKDMGIGVSTLYGWKAKEADIRKQAAVSMPGAKSTKGAEFAKVGPSLLSYVCCTADRRRSIFNSEWFAGF